jgi:hypothetical protein
MKRTVSFNILLALSLLIGISIFNDFGESWDELKLYDYAADSITAYGTWFQHGTIPVTGDRFENYGPFFVMLTRVITKSATLVFPGVQEVDIQHLIYFLTFLLGMWAFYQLALRWMSQNAAFGATVLFMSQPVFWGHAFINPKDIPLLSLFLLSVYLGMKMHDSIEAHSVVESVSAAWKRLPPRPQRLLLGALGLWLLTLFLMYGGTKVRSAPRRRVNLP